ncbi:MAG: RHS repeat-associated core domain-containing protein [Nitrospirota bacterium]
MVPESNNTCKVPLPGGDASAGGGTSGDGGPPPGSGSAGSDGDPVDLYTGLFVYGKTDMALTDTLPIAVKRIYRQNDSERRSFGVGTKGSYDFFLNIEQTGEKSQTESLNLVLPDGGRVAYKVAGNALEHTGTPSEYYKSHVQRMDDRWDLTLKNGTVYSFQKSSSICDSRLGTSVSTSKVDETYVLPSMIQHCTVIAGLTSIRDRHGNKLLFERDSADPTRIAKITSPHGRFVTFTYSTGLITKIEDNAGRTVGYAYDADGRLVQVTDINGGITRYAYDRSNRMTTVTDSRAILFLTNEYDMSGRVVKQTQADKSTYQFAYTKDANGKVIQTDVTNPRDAIRRVTFNANGYILSDTIVVGKPEQQTTTYQRDIKTNMVLSETDTLNRKTAYDYDAMGNLISITRMAGTAEAVTTAFVYHPALNKVTRITDPLQRTTKFFYNTQGSLEIVTDPMEQTTRFSYNALGQPTAVTDPLQNITRFDYDGFGNLATTTDPMGNKTQRAYDSLNRLTGVTDGRGFATQYTNDPLNRVVQITDAINGVTQFSYDPNGNLTLVRDAKRNPTNYSYDLMDRLEMRTDPLVTNEGYSYDANGNLIAFTDRKRQTTSYRYDGANRRIAATYADGYTDYKYDSGNRLEQISDSVSGVITLKYDNFDRLESETTLQGHIDYTYDVAGRRTGMTVLGQPTVTYTYDKANHLTGIAQGTTTVTLLYDAAGRRIRVTLPNKVVGRYAYDRASRITGITYSRTVRKKTYTVGSVSYEYDRVGNRKYVGGMSSDTDYDYDDLSRLTEVREGPNQSTTYTYDAVGNWTKIINVERKFKKWGSEVSAVYNDGNQMVQSGGQVLTYDANGNLLFDGAKTYTWDARNRLIGITSSGRLTASFSYDALGRRVSKTINGSKTEYLYDGNDIVAEINGGVVSTTYLRGLNIDEPFVRRQSSGWSEYFLADALGSTLELTNDNGIVTTRYSYDPFGKTMAIGSGIISSNPFQYTGRENDGTGLYYYRARYYSPKLQRFISEDPINYTQLRLWDQLAPEGIAEVTQLILYLQGYPELLNLYPYVTNNPLRYNDPYGLIGWDTVAKQIIKKIGGKIGKSLDDDTLITDKEEQDLLNKEEEYRKLREDRPPCVTVGGRKPHAC